MSNEKLACALGKVLNYAKQHGASFDDATVNKFLRDPHSKARYAEAANMVDESVNRRAIDALDKNSFTYKALNVLDEVGIPAHQIMTWVANPEYILGAKITNRVTALYEDHLAKYGRENKAVWNEQYRPKMKALYNDVYNDIPPELTDFADKYFQKHMQGGQLYGMTAPNNPVGKLINNVVEAFVKNNPMITSLNVFEFSPKALAHMAELGAPPEVLAKAIAKYAKETNGKFWQRIPRLEEAGVYGVKNQSYSGRFGKVGKFYAKHDLLNTTENPLRGLSYMLGEELESAGFKTSGAQTLEKVAFVNRFGNEPMVFMDSGSRETLTLMRYALSSAKMYYGLLKGAAQGNPKSIAALGAFSMMTALQTGSSSAVPAPVDFFLDKATNGSYRDTMKDIDKFSVSQGLLNTDLGKQTRPLGGFALGVGGNILNENIKAGAIAFGKGTQSLTNGDIALATSRYLESILSLAQLGRIPGVNLTTKKLSASLSEVIDGKGVEETLRDKLNFEEPK